ncbi:MAG: hypothetical protein WAV07_18470 [Candidatus Contendobacter sp.]
MTISTQVHTVCPHCKRSVTARPDQPRAQCPEHGPVVPMRSAIVNQPLPSTPPVTLLYAQLV